ncbi:hypothetical protein GCM10009535_38810 [Streptomyces thermocarboxydovorans]|uniref:Uncharacterized protein n=1 Tax=Streptomyces thermocarboxydovorans TaxID=59298 RepID=A0ABP3SUY9_9ACTN
MVRVRGALRYQSSLNRPTVVRLSSPSGRKAGAAGRREVSGHVQHGTARVLRRVPVGPTQAPGDPPAGPAAPDGRRGLLVRPRADQPGGGGSGAAPPRDGNGLGEHGGDRIALV